MTASSPSRHPSTALPVILLLVLVFLIIAVPPAAAQDAASIDGQSALPTIADVARQVVTDPTTYTPGVMLYTSMRLDWNTSQPLFQQGFVEENPRYTRSGLPRDIPVSYADGNRQILRDSLATLPVMLANNTVARFTERALITHFPDHPKLIHALGWIERISFSAYLSYRLSSPHIEQWQQNKRMIAALGTP